MSQLDVAGSRGGQVAVDLVKITKGLTDEHSRRHVWSLSTTLAAIGALSLFAVMAVSAWYVSGAVVPWDSKNHFYPMFRFLADALSNGGFPLWNPYHFGGHPTVADPQSLLFTPTMVLFAWLDPSASMEVFDGVIFAHLFLGGLGILALFRRRGWHAAGAVLAAMIFMLGGSAASRLQHTGMIISYAFFPIALLFLEEALDRASWRFAIAFGACAAMMAEGRDQVAFLLCCVIIGAVAARAIGSRKPFAYLATRSLVLAIGVFVSVALLIVPALLTMQFLGTSNRPGISFGVAAAGSLAPVNFITMLAPDFFGSLHWTYDYWGPGYETMSAPDWTDRAVNYLFIGTLPAMLLLWHGIAGGRLFGHGLRFFALVAIAAILYAVGRYTPFFAAVFALVPGVELYRRPADATFIINIAFAFAAGYLLHRYIDEALPSPFRVMRRWVGVSLAALAVGVLALTIGCGLAFSWEQNHLGDSLRELAPTALIIVAGVILLVVLAKRPEQRIAAALVLVAVTGGELVWRNADASINAEPAARYQVFSGLSPGDAAGLAVLRASIAKDMDRGQRPRVEILGLDGAWQNASMVFHLENTLGYNPLRIADYETAVGPGENAVDFNLRQFPGTFRGYRCTLASLLGLEYLVIDRPLTKMPRHVPRPLATQIYSDGHMYIYKLGATAPRAYLATIAVPVDASQILADHSLPQFDRTREVLIDQSSMGLLRSDYPASDFSANSNVTIAAYHDNRVVIEVDTDKPGIVVLHDLYYTGWQAKVDGEPMPVLRANVLFRGVEVPAGHHIVSFDFHPFALENLAKAAGHLIDHGASD